jgi:hypothetical protein
MLFSRSAKSRTMTISYILKLKILLTKHQQSDAFGAVDGQPLDVTEAIILAHGFTNAMLDALVWDGLATAEQREMRAGPDDGRWACSKPAGPSHPARSPAHQRGCHLAGRARCSGTGSSTSSRAAAPRVNWSPLAQHQERDQRGNGREGTACWFFRKPG